MFLQKYIQQTRTSFECHRHRREKHTFHITKWNFCWRRFFFLHSFSAYIRCSDVTATDSSAEAEPFFNRKPFESHMEIAEFTARKHVCIQYLRVGNKNAHATKYPSLVVLSYFSPSSLDVSANVISSKFRCKQNGKKCDTKKKKKNWHR